MLPARPPGDDNVIWINGSGTLIDRTKLYNKAIHRKREEIVGEGLLSSNWQNISDNITVIYGGFNDTIQQMKNVDIVTIALRWQPTTLVYDQWSSTEDYSNVLIQSYYQWTASKEFCDKYVRKKSEGWISRWDTVFNGKCYDDMGTQIAPRSLDVLTLRAKSTKSLAQHNVYSDIQWRLQNRYPDQYYTNPPLHVFYVHIARHALITEQGNVISGTTEITPSSCMSMNSADVPSNVSNIPLYDEVFTIRQHWDTQYYHFSVESAPRLAPYLDFLIAHPSIMIHVGQNTKLVLRTMELLNLDPKRLVTSVVRAKIGYQPSSTYCYFAHPQYVQLLSRYYGDYINSHFTPQNR